MPLRILTIMLFALLPAGAQEPAVKVSASFYAFSTVADHQVVKVRNGATSFEDVRLSTANIVGPHTCVIADGKITIHTSTAEVRNGKPMHPVIALGAIKEGMKKVLVVLFPAPPGGTDKYKCLVFNHDFADFPLGVYRLINLSNKPVRGAVGREVVRANPGSIGNLQLKGQPGDIVPVRFEFLEEERWNLLTETRAAIRNDRRWLMCIYQDPTSGRMNIRSIPDRTRTDPVPVP